MRRRRCTLWMMMFALGACDKSATDATSPARVTGVAECDEYLAKVDSCFAKDPKAKAAMEPNFVSQREAWKAMAASNAEGAKSACKSALSTFGATYSQCK